jgi:sialic acid synthase SpsE
MLDNSKLVETLGLAENLSKVFIIGKGKSLDSISRLEALIEDDEALVVNLNDSFSIAEGSLAIITNNKSKKSFENSNLSKLKLVVSDEEVDGYPTATLEWINESSLNHRRTLEDMKSDDIRLHKFSLVTALHVCAFLARRLSRNLNVYLLGMDFVSEFASDAIRGEKNDSAEYTSSFLSAQLRFMELLLPHLVNYSLFIRHIGSQSFSWMTSEAFSSFINPNNDNQNKQIIHRENKPRALGNIENGVSIVAEITTNHFGDRERLFAMVRAAASAGADMVKLQCRHVESFYSQEQLDTKYDSPFGKTFRDYREALELSDEDFFEVDRLCKSLGIEWFASILDWPSYERMQKFDLNKIKLPSTISEHRDFLIKVAADFKGSIILSTGYTDQSYEKFILQHFRHVPQLYFLQCTSSYPTPDSDAQIAVVRHYARLAEVYTNIIPGYSSHDVGSLGCQLAAAAGAKYVEKHVRFGTVSWAHFDDVAIDLSDDSFSEFVNDVRRAEILLGSEKKEIKPSEHHKYWPRS